MGAVLRGICGSTTTCIPPPRRHFGFDFRRLGAGRPSIVSDSNFGRRGARYNSGHNSTPAPNDLACNSKATVPSIKFRCGKASRCKRRKPSTRMAQLTAVMTATWLGANEKGWHDGRPACATMRCSRPCFNNSFAMLQTDKYKCRFSSPSSWSMKHPAGRPGTSMRGANACVVCANGRRARCMQKYTIMAKPSDSGSPMRKKPPTLPPTKKRSRETDNFKASS